MFVMSLTSTTVTVNFMQPEGSLPYDEYQVLLTPTTRDQQVAYEEVTTDDVETEWLVEFGNLSEFTMYNMTITITNFNFRVSRQTSFEISTLATCKSEKNGACMVVLTNDQD